MGVFIEYRVSDVRKIVKLRYGVLLESFVVFLLEFRLELWDDVIFVILFSDVNGGGNIVGRNFICLRIRDGLGREYGYFLRSSLIY